MVTKRNKRLVDGIADEAERALKQLGQWTEDRAAGRTVHIPDNGAEEPGDVPAGVMPALHALVAAHGFKVVNGLYEAATKSLEEAGITPAGYTVGVIPAGVESAHPPMQVRIREGMSSAANARVLLHEAGHVLLGHSPTDQTAAKVAMVQRVLRSQLFGDSEDPREEIAVQLASGAVCRLADIGTGEWSTAYLAQRMMHPLLVENAAAAVDGVCDEALRAAEALWPVVRDAAA
jgi:hypothetical protein